MKVLFVHDCLGALGGAETNIHLTATELKRRGHEVALLYGRGTGKNEADWRTTFSYCFALGEEKGEPKFIGSSAARHGQRALPAFDSEKAWTVITALEKFCPEIIYLHNLADLDLLETLLMTGVPVVRMVHDHQMYCMRGYKYNYFSRRICTRSASFYCVFPCLASIGRSASGQGLKWVSYAAKRREISLNQQCDRLVAYSEYSKAELVRNGFDQDKIHIHVPIRCAQTETPLSSFSDRNLIVFAGQIIRGKGVDVLLKALAKVTVPFECVILGEGNHRRYCERLCARLALTERVKFRGFVRQDELVSFYREASLCVMSSVWPEPFGMAGPEAMRCGLPVVAFEAGGIHEWLIHGENGYLVPWMDTELFAARIKELLQNKGLARRMGQHGRSRVYRQYEASRQVEGLEQMFECVLQEAREKKEFRASNAVERVLAEPGMGNGDGVEGAPANLGAGLLPRCERLTSFSYETK